MPKHIADPPLVASWVRKVRNKSTPQYATLVRAFLRDCRIVDPSVVTAAVLRDYAADMENDSMRRRAIPALSAFYAFATREIPLLHDPSAALFERVHETLELRKRQRALLEAGVDVARTREMRWRDVGVVGMIGDRRPDDVVAALPIGAAPMKTLFEKLLTSIRELPPEDVEAFLDSQVLVER